MNIPNALSVFRIILIPIFIHFYTNVSEPYMALLVLFLSGASDFLDGVIARKFNMITYLGQILDPIADKLTQAAVGICVAIVHRSFIPALVVFFIKEICMALGTMIFVKKNVKLTAAKFAGKLSTAVMYLVLAVLIIVPDMPSQIVMILSVISIVVLSNALVCYFRIFMSEYKKG